MIGMKRRMTDVLEGVCFVDVYDLWENYCGYFKLVDTYNPFTPSCFIPNNPLGNIFNRRECEDLRNDKRLHGVRHVTLQIPLPFTTPSLTTLYLSILNRQLNSSSVMCLSCRSSAL